MNRFKNQKALWLFLAAAAVALLLVFRFSGSPKTESKPDNAESLTASQVTIEEGEVDRIEPEPSSSKTEAAEEASSPSSEDGYSEKTSGESIKSKSEEKKETQTAIELPIDVISENTEAALPNNESENETSVVTAKLPPEPIVETIKPSEEELTCTLSVRCDTLLENLSLLDAEKIELVPTDGVLYPEQSVAFSEGETVFDVLQREMRRCQIHMEYSVTPLYNSVYIEGIGNLYEIDAGDLSGWMYRVNGVFPNYGCSLYELKSGDRIEWVYTCDLGVDVGGAYASQGVNS